MLYGIDPFLRGKQELITPYSPRINGFMNHKIKIQIAYALPNHYYLKAFTVDDGTMVQTAILQSGILTQFNDIDLRNNKVGIFSRPVKLTDLLKEGDRIEIYRPLLADPKEIRRKRAEEQGKKNKSS